MNVQARLAEYSALSKSTKFHPLPILDGNYWAYDYVEYDLMSSLYGWFNINTTNF